jgi:hypothetical protein
MKREDIIRVAENNKAKEFLAFAEAFGLAPTILDQDNVRDPNDGYLNVIVNGLARGEAILFVDGEFSGL